MLAILGFATILIFLILIITRRVSVITALILVPVIIGLVAGVPVKGLSDMALAG
ncbi:MAG: hypothetical protein RLZZ316_1131, partial [Bacteroidota bacterium]